MTRTSPSFDPVRIAEVSRLLALEAGREILRLRGCAPRFKADGSPVTEGDLAADAILREGLAAAFPEIPVVTEEQEEAHALGAPAEAFFLIDPLDGTKAYVRGEDDFTVNIALILRGEPVAGVLYAPAYDRLARSLPEGGAEEERPSTGARRRIEARRAPRRPLVLTANRTQGAEATRLWLAQFPEAQVLLASSSVKFLFVAAGEADAYRRPARIHEWDTAAGDAVLRAAGGFTQDFAGRPLVYGKPGFASEEFIAFAPSFAAFVRSEA